MLIHVASSIQTVCTMTITLRSNGDATRHATLPCANGGIDFLVEAIYLYLLALPTRIALRLHEAVVCGTLPPRRAEHYSSLPHNSLLFPLSSRAYLFLLPHFALIRSISSS